MSEIDSLQHDLKGLHQQRNKIRAGSFVRWLMVFLLVVSLTGCTTLEPQGGTADSSLGGVRELPEITPFGMP